MESKLLTKKYFLYATEFFAGMSVMAVELGASRLMAPYFSSSQIVWTVIIGVIMIRQALRQDPHSGYLDRPDPLCGTVPDRRHFPAACGFCEP